MGGRGREGCVRLGDGLDLVSAGCGVSWEGAGSNLETALAVICMITGEVRLLVWCTVNLCIDKISSAFRITSIHRSTGDSLSY